MRTPGGWFRPIDWAPTSPCRIRRVNELVALSGDEVRRTRAVENYQKLLIRFHSAADTKDQERILTVLRSQQESLSKAGMSIPELDSYLPTR